MRPADGWVDRVATEHAGGRAVALLFDYDGTLTPIVVHPDRAHLPQATRGVLARLATADRVAVGVLSGRALPHVRELVGLPGVMYAGSGGMYLDLNGEEHADPAAAGFDVLADAVVAALADAVRWFPGAWLERKPGCLSVHFRALTPLKAACFQDEVHGALGELAADAPGMRVREVTKALEVTLAGTWTKGDAVDRILATLPPGTFPVYAGDGANDAEAVDRVNALGGLTLGTGPEAPAGVQMRLDGPTALAADLAVLAARLSCGGPPCSPAGGRLTPVYP